MTVNNIIQKLLRIFIGLLFLVLLTGFHMAFSKELSGGILNTNFTKAGFIFSIATEQANDGLRHIKLVLPNRFNGKDLVQTFLLVAGKHLMLEQQIWCPKSDLAKKSFCEFRSRDEFLIDVKLKVVYSNGNSDSNDEYILDFEESKKEGYGWNIYHYDNQMRLN